MYYRKLYKILVAPQEEWQWGAFGYETWCKWDGIARSETAAIAYKDPCLLSASWDLLQPSVRRRWPIELDSPLDMNPPPGKKKYGNVRRMTRDPYIMGVCAEYFIGNPKFTTLYKMPFHIRRPHIEAWKKYLATKKRSWKWIYEKLAFLSLLISSNKIFVLHLAAWMAYAADSDKMKKEIRKHVPEWNFMILALCGVYIRDNVDYINYRSKIRYQWTDETKMEDSEWCNESWYLPEGEQYYLDKDILEWVLNR